MAEARTHARARRWDIYGRVIDNFGDVGVCWRLACDLAERGQRVRLVLDDTRALAWMAPQGHAGVDVQSWPGYGDNGDVVIEAFGCELPLSVVERMAATSPAQPLWINLEYLSAETYVERSHALPSPQPRGLMKWFFFPGFTPRTGGLLREASLLRERAAFDRHAWLRAQGIEPLPTERIVSLFCYVGAPLMQWLDHEPERPTLLLLTPGPAQALPMPQRANLRTVNLPWLPQAEYDRLLWSCDLNFVRGEDSLVRALWAGVPFVWQAYRQHDDVHLHKLEAMIERLALPTDVAMLWRAWNATTPPLPWPAAPQFAAWQEAARRACHAQSALPDLVTQLLGFAPNSATPRC